MWFHQDDIGVLIDLVNKSFWETLWISQGEHFSPLYNIVWAIQWRLFHLNYFPYVLFPLFVHLLNIILLVKIVRLFSFARPRLAKLGEVVAVLLFTASVTYTEPLLWFTVQGISLATLLVGLAFYFWLKNKFWWSILFSFLSGFAFGLGIGVGVIFGILTITQISKLKSQNQNLNLKTIIFLYFLTGIISYLVGPAFLGERLGGRIIEWRGVADILEYAGFILVGISRGVVGRLFLPGFEPPNEDILGTVLSFIPFILIVGLFIKMAYPKFLGARLPLRCGFAAARLKIWARPFDLLLFTSIFVIYPYVWAGFLRYQFGLKQALAERYAYPALFFFVILVALIVNYLVKEKIIRSQKVFIVGAMVIFILQLYFFHQKAKIWEERPLRTKKYFEVLEEKVKRGRRIKDEPLPKFINQEFYSTYDLMPIFGKK